MKNSGGYTLVELLIAIAMLLIAAVVVSVLTLLLVKFYGWALA